VVEKPRQFEFVARNFRENFSVYSNPTSSRGNGEFMSLINRTPQLVCVFGFGGVAPLILKIFTTEAEPRLLYTKIT